MKVIGKKCYLHKIGLKEKKIITGWRNDLEVIKMLKDYYMMNGNDPEEVLGKILDEYNYSIKDMFTNELIGNCGFFEIDRISKKGKLVVFIGNKKYWNMGYDVEAMSLLPRNDTKHFCEIQVNLYDNKRIKKGFKILGG